MAHLRGRWLGADTYRPRGLSCTRALQAPGLEDLIGLLCHRLVLSLETQGRESNLLLGSPDILHHILFLWFLVHYSFTSMILVTKLYPLLLNLLWNAAFPVGWWLRHQGSSQLVLVFRAKTTHGWGIPIFRFNGDWGIGDWLHIWNNNIWLLNYSIKITFKSEPSGEDWTNNSALLKTCAPDVYLI
jgi:hypothetical protein